MTEHTDVLILGAGTAGNTAARALARAGRTILIAEPDRVGGTCLWRGCMPKKALYHAAAVARNVARAEQFGISAGHPSIDWPAVLAWKWHAQETYAGDQDGILASLGVERLTGSGRFVSPDTVDVGGRIVAADHIVVATGARPVTLDVPGAELADTSDDALRYPTLPESLCIVGAGYIALEFAGIYASLGTRVTVLSRGDDILAPFDRECVAIARTALEELGVQFLTGVRLTGISGAQGALTVVYDLNGTSHEHPCERALAAVGRRPAYDDMALEAAGISFDGRGQVLLDDALRSANPRVYFAGDAAGREQHTPIANLHGRAVAASILGSGNGVPDTNGIPFTCFTVPELAQTGLTVAAASLAGLAVDAHSTTYEYLGAAIISDVRHGLVKIVAEQGTGVVVGGHVAGERASDLIYPLSLAVRERLTIDRLQAAMGVHPAFSEAVNWASF